MIKAEGYWKTAATMLRWCCKYLQAYLLKDKYITRIFEEKMHGLFPESKYAKIPKEFANIFMEPMNIIVAGG